MDMTSRSKADEASRVSICIPFHVVVTILTAYSYMIVSVLSQGFTLSTIIVAVATANASAAKLRFEKRY